MSAAPAGWIRLGSRVDVPEGKYQIRLAAAGSDGTLGSVFTDVVVPDFGDDLVLGGLSLGSATSTTARLAELLAGVLPLVPLASPEFTSGAQLVAQVPVRVRSRNPGPLMVTATLRRANEPARTLDTSASVANEYATPQGKVFSVPLPADLEAGSYRLAIEAARGRDRARRENRFHRAVSAVGRPPADKGHRRSKFSSPPVRLTGPSKYTLRASRRRAAGGPAPVDRRDTRCGR